MDVGSKIKQYRLKQGLTLAELASRTELTKGYLSQLENDLTSPSIATLADICEAFGISMSEFFTQHKAPQVVFTSQDYFEDKHDEYTIEWIVPNAVKNQMQPILLTLEGAGSSQEFPVHDGQEMGYVLQGKIELIFEDQTKIRLKKGETFYLFGNQSYIIRNRSQQKSQLLWVSNPPSL